MRIDALKISGLWVANLELHLDERGLFCEWFKFDEISKFADVNFSVKQANISVSKKGVLRGIHYSLAKNGQSKWVTCLSGRILDVVVDLRADSPTFRKYELIELNGGDGKAVLVGSGLGHGFLSLQENSMVSYLLDSPYSPNNEYVINPFDLELGIKWPNEDRGNAKFKLSPKDLMAPTLFQQLSNNKLPSLR